MGEQMKTRTFNFKKRNLERLRSLAEKYCFGMSQIVDRSLERTLDEIETSELDIFPN